MPGARILWMVTMKFRPVRIDEKPAMKTPDRGGDDEGVRVGGAERSVEGPAGIHAAHDDGGDARTARPTM